MDTRRNPMMVQKTSVCQICGCNCGLLVTLDRGQIVEVKGDPQIPQNKGGTCIKGKFSPQVLYAPDRLKTPLIRRRGGTSYMSLSWDDALNEISERLEQIKNKTGPEALAIYRGRSTRFIDRTFISAFARLFGTPNVTGVWTLCVGPKVIGYKATFGAPLFPACDFGNAKLIALWGTNPSASKMHRYFNLPNDIHSAIKKGAELVIVDPRWHRFADDATLHLPITPGTDTYLILSLVKILIEHGWTDDAFIRKYTSGYDRLCDAAKKVNIQDASQITGIPSETIMELAKKLATIKPASIDRREGVIHQVNGTQINRALAILTAITGNVDRIGGLRFTALPSWDTSLGIEDKAKAPSIWSQQYPLAADGAQALTDSVLEQNPYPIRALISISGNPVSALPNTKRTLAALAKLDFLVVNDLFMTETARMADIVLPGVTFYEKGEFHNEPLKPVPWLQTTEPLVKPIGDAKPEWHFIAELSARMGFQELSGFAGEDEILRRVFIDSGRSELDPVAMRRGMRLDQPDFGTLLENGFNTPSGKIELYSTWLAQKGYPPLPTCEDSCQCGDRFPYRLVTGSRSNAFNHSQHRNIPDLLKFCPFPEAEISPKIAADIGVADGEFIAIETEWGQLSIRTKIVHGMNQYTVSIPHGWPGKENANYLCGDESRDSISGTPAYKSIPCTVRREEPESD